MDMMSSCDDYDAEPMTTDMLEDICDGSKYHLIINRRESRYKICDCVQEWQLEWKGALFSAQNMGKGIHKVFKAVGHKILEALPILGESGLEVSYLIPQPRNFEELTRLSE